ncbi:MAG: ABC transporter ATP-binding protein [Eubacterium sp.]|nr:ABC transporter ATP-binding protein [Eubacterium sp.]
MTDEFIRLEHISKQFGQAQVLKDLCAVLHKGEILGFLGPSGAGKTTTIRILTGQLKADQGNAYVLGTNVTNIDETIYEQIGIVTDQSGVYERFSVYDNLRYFAKILKAKPARIEEILKQTGLYEHRKKPAGKLSKGQMQRLILSRAVLHKPKVLFLDEPTSGLDPSTALEIHRMLLQLRDEGMAIFLTTHNMEEATKLCGHVALLNDGQIMEYGTPQELCLRYNKQKQYRILLDDGSKLVMGQKEEEVSRLSALLRANRINSLHSCEPTLESVFLTVTGRCLQ